MIELSWSLQLVVFLVGRPPPSLMYLIEVELQKLFHYFHTAPLNYNHHNGGVTLLVSMLERWRKFRHNTVRFLLYFGALCIVVIDFSERNSSFWGGGGSVFEDHLQCLSGVCPHINEFLPSLHLFN